jgi:hypothetical protein
VSYVRQLALYAVLLLLTLTLTGCIKSDYHVQLNKDESVDIVVTVGLDQSIVGSEALEGIELIQGLYDSLVEQGFGVKDYLEGNISGVVGAKHLDSYADLITTDGSVIGITRTDSLFYRKYSIRGEFDLSSMDEDSYPELSEDQFTKAFYDTFDLKFRLTLPGMATRHNATEAHDKTLIWALKMGKNNPISADVAVLKSWVILLATLIGLGLLSALTVLFKKRMPSVKKAS